MSSAGLYASLPKPSKVVYDRDEIERQKRSQFNEQRALAVKGARAHIPAYGQRKGWVPRSQADYGDGGAYPECHVAQFPLEMGRKSGQGDSKVLPIQLDAEGKIKYDIIVTNGHRKDVVVYNKLSDLLPSEVVNEDDPVLQKPNDEEVQDLTELTRAALEKLTSTKITAAAPVRAVEKLAPAKYIRYTPSNQGEGHNAGANQRIIRMVEVQKDPLEPPKFKINKKIPQAPPSPPPPIMHSPTRKVTVKEQQEWKIPPCISNWKNAKGYTIPLDKRLAADGRGLQQVHINENFAKLSEALHIADRKAREAVEMRGQMEKKIAQKEKEKKEENLRKLAQKARDERAGIRSGTADEDIAERDEIRKDRHRERQRDKNIQRAAPDKRNRLERERERDISEQVALGMANPRVSASEVQFDQRLFNQNKGLGTGFGHEDDYDVYDKPWRAAGALAQGIYRPSKGKEDEILGDDVESLASTSRFVPDKGFGGVDREAKRDGPVQFEKQPEEEDPFGLDKFLAEAKKVSKRPENEANYENRASYKRSRKD
ncbi:SNW domain-containing protein 1 [Halotydeus destructor]|nr:SNW domain-containing protein 1 [Halotydeus destructor]